MLFKSFIQYQLCLEQSEKLNDDFKTVPTNTADQTHLISPDPPQSLNIFSY